MKQERYILSRIGKALQDRIQDAALEPLPKRLVELLLCLDAKDREQSEASQKPIKN